MKYILRTLLIISLININSTISMDNNYNQKDFKNQNDINQKYPKIKDEQKTPPSSPTRTIPVCPGAPRKQITGTNPIKPIALKKLIF